MFLSRVEKIPWRGGNPLQFSCLKNPMDREGWQATVHGIANSRTRLKWLSMQALSLMFCALFVYNSGVKHSALNVLMCHNEKELCSLSHISLLLSYLFSPTMFHQKCSENIFLKTYFLFLFSFFTRASQIALVVKNLQTNVGDIRDSG